ncbi:hypothetical protein [Bradyrhizobium sp. RT11b]|uniref:hypothetical protein n=1 Tax=Bradyrhizobium sp. RT11b TaxID=3156332 RepID=UPI0033937D97
MSSLSLVVGPINTAPEQHAQVGVNIVSVLTDVPGTIWAIAGLFAVAFLLVTCAHADDAPDWAVRVMNETHKRVVVEHQDWYAKD